MLLRRTDAKLELNSDDSDHSILNNIFIMRNSKIFKSIFVWLLIVIYTFLVIIV